MMIRLTEVKRLTGLGKTAIYAAMRDGTFPQSVKLSHRAVGWHRAEVDSWIEQRLDQRPPAPDQASRERKQPPRNWRKHYPGGASS